jgi:hypothetical protein
VGARGWLGSGGHGGDEAAAAHRQGPGLLLLLPAVRGRLRVRPRAGGRGGRGRREGGAGGERSPPAAAAAGPGAAPQGPRRRHQDARLPSTAQGTYSFSTAMSCSVAMSQPSACCTIALSGVFFFVLLYA